MSVQILLLISELDGGRFAIQCVSPLKILDINTLPDVSLSTFPTTYRLLFFGLLVVSLAVQKPFNLIR